MKSSWIDTRKDIFIRDLVRDFIDASLYFHHILTEFEKIASLPYHMLDTWVGTETKKGALWNLKDQSHRLFRSGKSKSNLYEHLFDWTIGSIFHESMKLKEDAYQIESYKPLLELEVTGHNENKELSKIIAEYFSLIEKARKNLKDEIKRIEDLFSRAIFHLCIMFPLYGSNIQLLRFVLDNRQSVEAVFGNDSFDQILCSMFPEGTTRAYIAAAEYCIKNGWYGDAQTYLKQILPADKHHERSCELLKEVEEKINSVPTKEPPA